MAGIYPKLSILPLAQPGLAGENEIMSNVTSTNATGTVGRRPLLSWIALGVVYVVWGSTYLAIRVGVGHLPPLLFAGIRYVVAGALLYPIARRATTRSRGPGEPGTRPGVKAWLAGAAVGILLLSAGNGGVTFAETRLPSGFAAVLVATVPLWMIVFAWALQHQRVAGRSAAGLLVGLAGVVVLVGSATPSGGIIYVIIVLGAAAAWGFGSVLSNRLPVPGHALLAAAIEMLAGGVVLLLVAAGTGEFSHVRWSAVPATSWIALAYLIGPGSILAFTAYGYALSHLPVTTVSTYAYVNPVVAVLAGVVILGEHLSLREALGAALVVGSVVIILHRTRKSARPGPAGDRAAPDTGTPDTGTPDTGTPDTGRPDAGTPRAGTPAADTFSAAAVRAGTLSVDAPSRLSSTKARA
jgi:drug/metabolite transporter (DMT)-like permease